MAMKKIYIGFFLAYEGETASHMDKSSILARFEFSWQVQAQLWRSADMLWPVNSQTEGGLGFRIPVGTIQASFLQVSLCPFPRS